MKPHFKKFYLKFSLNLPRYTEQFEMNFITTDLRPGKVRGLYKHQLLSPCEPKFTYHPIIDQLIRMKLFFSHLGLRKCSDSVYIAHCIYCIAALYINAGMQKGDRIFIHADSCGIGQAVINLALREGYEIFTTERRRFFKETFPSIDDNHIGNSRDINFEKIILQRTNGAGVNIVLNSLADDKLQVSLYYSAHKGRFLKIGKFDFATNNQISTK
ncbi:fatty acid synthase-like [Vespula maculifrons]|uniref:Fatty acid synthase-like n=1 Tax=Vespula maculifrons TaxID=7453 RepID=A0ABD2CT58_VESMC